MPHTEFFTLTSQQDGLELSLMLVRPDGEPRALVQLAHGMCEHKERYLPFMEFLAERGCLCVMNDHRGHGASIRVERKDLGYFYENGDEALVEDLHQISLWLRERWQGVPLILFGHSMGSLAVRAYAEKYDRKLDSLIISGSPGKNAAAGFGLALIKLLTRLYGDRHRGKLMLALTLGPYVARFPDKDHPCAWLSANMENVEEYERDPLCHFRFTLNGNRALLRLMQRAYSIRAPRGNASLPVRFYSGEDDPCAPDRKGFDAAMESMRRAGYRDVQGRMFPGLRHEILREKNAREIFETIWAEAIEPVLGK